MPPLAGALGIPTGRFLLLDGLGSLFYAGFYIGAGFLFHNQLQEMMAMLNQLGFSALLLALVLVPGYIVFKYVRRRRHLVGPIHHRNARETEADAIEGNEGVARMIATQRTGHIVGDKTGALSRESVVLSLTSTTSQSTRDDATSSLVQTAPSGL